MKLPKVNNIKASSITSLSAIFLLVSFFVFNHPAASSHQQFTSQTTEYVQAGTYLNRGLKLPDLFRTAGERIPANTRLFSKFSVSAFHSRLATVRTKLAQAATTKRIFHPFYMIKSIPQSGKNDLPAILA